MVHNPCINYCSNHSFISAMTDYITASKTDSCSLVFHWCRVGQLDKLPLLGSRASYSVTSCGRDTRKDGLVINTWSMVLVENGCCIKTNPNKSLLITWDPDKLYNWPVILSPDGSLLITELTVTELMNRHREAVKSISPDEYGQCHSNSYLFLSASSLNLVAARSNSSRKVSSALMLISSVYTQRSNARATSSCMSEKKNSSLSSVQDSVSTCSGKPAYIPPHLS